ncbi:hypothetical protein [Paenibacillus sp. 2TAB19]|uniref:hypothetical protein n=1 Tax=Paenibacillus sp. 2TAB19 TaxID=3233003 RepID=UPI003F9AB9AB
MTATFIGLPFEVAHAWGAFTRLMFQVIKEAFAVGFVVVIISGSERLKDLYLLGLDGALYGTLKGAL